MTSTTGKQSLSKIAKSFESLDKTREANRCKDVKNYSNKPCSNNRDGRLPNKQRLRCPKTAKSCKSNKSNNANDSFKG